MERTYKPYNEYTLEREINAGKSVDFSHSNFQLKIKEDGIIHSYASIFSMYSNILTPYIYEKTFTNEEYLKYFQKPKLLSYDMYGTPELWSGLLYINNMVSVADFKKKKIKVFSSNIIDVIDEIRTIYYDDFNNNKNQVYSK